MKFSTSKTELQKALQKLSIAIPTRSTLPILNSVFIKISETEASLKSTDLEVGIETKIPVSVEEEGSVCIPLKTLLNINEEGSIFQSYIDGAKKLLVPTIDFNHLNLYDMSDYIQSISQFVTDKKVENYWGFYGRISSDTTF